MKSKHIKLLLIAVLALVMAFALVACNGDKKNNNNNDNIPSINDYTQNVELSKNMKQLVEDAREDVDAMFNFFLSYSQKSEFSSFQLVCSDTGIVCLFDGDNTYFEIGIYSTEEALRRHEDSFFGGIMIGNKKIIAGGRTDEEGNVVDENSLVMYKIIKESTRPDTVTKLANEQIEFVEKHLHRGLDKSESTYRLQIAPVFENDFYDVVVEIVPLQGNCNTGLGILHDIDASLMEKMLSIKRFMSINYTEDSYIRFDEKAGLCYAKLIDKPGWHVEEIENIDGSTMKYDASFYYDKLPADIIVPAKIGDYDIDMADIDLNANDTLDSVVIEKALGNVNVFDEYYGVIKLNGNIKRIDIPVCDSAFVEIRNNVTLKTINFGGTTQQWEELYGHSAQNWTHVYDNNEGKYVDISFTVVCTNGNITYPKTNA